MLELVNQRLALNIVNICLDGELLLLDEEMRHVQVVFRVTWIFSVAEQTVVDVESLEYVEGFFGEVDD